MLIEIYWLSPVIRGNNRMVPQTWVWSIPSTLFPNNYSQSCNLTSRFPSEMSLHAR